MRRVHRVVQLRILTVAVPVLFQIQGCVDLTLPPPPPKVRAADGATPILTAGEILNGCTATAWQNAVTDQEANKGQPGRLAIDAACRTAEQVDSVSTVANKAAADAAAAAAAAADASSLVTTAATVCAHAVEAYTKPLPSKAIATRTANSGNATCSAPATCLYAFFLNPKDRSSAELELLGKTPGCNVTPDASRGTLFACCSALSASQSISLKPTTVPPVITVPGS